MNNYREIFVLIIIVLLSGLNLNAQEKDFHLNIITKGIYELRSDKPSYEKLFSDSLSIREEIKLVLSELHNRAYLTASVDSIIYEAKVINAFLNPGQKYYWANISLENIDKSVLKKTGIKENVFRNKPVVYNKYLKANTKIINWYENNSYPFVSSTLTNVNFGIDKITADLIIDKKNRIVFDSINIEGETKISQKYLNLYTGIFPGQSYNEKLVSTMSKKLEEIAFLDEHRPFELEFTQEKAKLYLYLKKRKANRFSGILALYQRDSYTGKLGLAGELSFLLHNSFAKGERISFDWKKLESTSQRLDSKFNYPFLFSSPIGFGFEFGLYKKDSSYLNLNTRIDLQYSFSGRNSYHIFFKNYSSSVLKSTGSIISNSKISDYNTSLYGIGINYEKLDYNFNPLKGLVLLLDFGAGNKKYTNDKDEEENSNNNTDETYLEFTSDISYYIKLEKRMTFKLRNLSGYKQSDNLYENELFRIGGLKTIRGFEEESFLADAYSVFNLEYRYLFERNSSFYAFFDVGYYQKPEENSTSNDTPFGFGIGVDFETRAGIFTLNYALGSQQGNPVEFGSGKIYFGLVNRF